MVLRAGSVGAPFSNKFELFETTYDFSADTGATGTYVMTAGASEAMMVRLVGMKVDTAVTSAGAATLAVSTSTSANAFVTAEGKATFTLGAFVAPEDCTTASAGFVKVAADDTLDLDVATAALTAGKIRFLWEVAKF